MSHWHTRENKEDGSLEVKFLQPRERFWPVDVIRHAPLEVNGAAGRTVVLTGSAGVWMYAHAAAVLQVAGAGLIRVDTPYKPGTSEDLEGSESRFIPAGLPHGNSALLAVRLRTSPPLSPAAIDRLLEPKLEELARLRPRELVLSGRASSAVYARAARTAVENGVRRIACWSARDGLVVVYDPDGIQVGQRIAVPGWVTEAMPRPISPLIIGVTGDPNSGKSVFSGTLDSYRERIGCDGWRLDCDGQAPTPPWYLSLVGQVSADEARQLREEHKRPWNSEMELNIAGQLRRAREIFPVLIADLPGGNHSVNPAQRVPAGRERLFAEIDVLILIERADKPAETAWRESLRPHGLEGWITAVLTSCAPQGPSSLSVEESNGFWRGEVRGLDRSRSASDLTEAFRPGLDRLWAALLYFPRREPAD